MTRGFVAVVVLATLATAVLTACTAHSPRATTPVTGPASVTAGPSTSPTTSAARTPAPAPSTAPADPAHAALARMSEAQRVGLLFMAGCPTSGVDDAATNAIRTYHVGSIYLSGDSSAGTQAITRVTSRLQQLAGDTRLFIATDQEGGQVQRLTGPGFADMPSALQQGQLTPGQLREDARTWGAQLAAAGVNVDLAPVMDTVPSPAFAPQNPPIGAYDREFGYDIATVASHGVAFAQGLAESGVDATLKHFPGLGRVTGNTDTTSGVTDTTTTATDDYLAPFAAGITAGAPFVMVSTAIYARIDPTRPAAFSPAVIGTILRGALHFTGVVISDDLGAARQVSGYSVGDRAVDFIAAGGDMVLTVDARQIPEMTAAVLRKANSDSTFRAQVDAAALRVLQAKAARDLI